MNHCKKCGAAMVGEGEECSDCAFPALKRASDAAAQAVERRHLALTGKQRILRGDIPRHPGPGGKRLPQNCCQQICNVAKLQALTTLWRVNRSRIGTAC